MKKKEILLKTLDWLNTINNNSRENILNLTYREFLILTEIEDLKAIRKFNLSNCYYDLDEILTLSLKKTNPNEITFYHTSKVKNSLMKGSKFYAYYAMSTYKSMKKIILNELQKVTVQLINNEIPIYSWEIKEPNSISTSIFKKYPWEINYPYKLTTKTTNNIIKSNEELLPENFNIKLLPEGFDLKLLQKITNLFKTASKEASILVLSFKEMLALLNLKLPFPIFENQFQLFVVSVEDHNLRFTLNCGPSPYQEDFYYFEYYFTEKHQISRYNKRFETIISKNNMKNLQQFLNLLEEKLFSLQNKEKNEK